MAKKARKKRSAKTAAKPAILQDDPALKLHARQAYNRKEWRIASVLFLAALAVRSVYFIINKNHNPLFYNPILDPLFHHEWAEDILSGNFWGDEVFFRAPLYPYLLAFLYKISGSSTAFSIYCQHVMGSMSVVLIYFLSRQFFPVKISFLAGLFAVLYWPLIYFEGDLLVVTLAVFLDVFCLLLISLAVKRDSVRLLFVSGLILGLSAITRPSILILIPVLPAVFYFSGCSGGRSSSKEIKSWWRRTMVVIAGLLIVTAPVILRNYIVGRDIVPIVSQGGVNFYIGNNPESNGSRAYVPGAPPNMYGTFQGAIELAENETGRRMKPSEISNYYFKKGLNFIFSSPAAAGVLFLKKLYFFMSGVERSNNKFIQFFWRRFGLGKMHLPGFWLITPFAMLAGVLLWRRRRELALFYLFFLSYMVSVVMFFINARFRLPVVPVLLIFSAYAFFYLFYAVRSRGYYFGKALLILVACEFIVNYDFIAFRGVRAADEVITYYELGNAYMKIDDKDSALNEYESARAVQEKYPTRTYQEYSDEINYQIGFIYWERGLCSRAIEALKRVQGSDEIAIDAQRLLADCYVKKGKIDEATSIYMKILRNSPEDVKGRLGLAVVYRISGEADLLDLSEQILRALSQNPHAYNEKVYLELARTLEAKGAQDEAIFFYQSAAQDLSLQKEALLNLAWLYKKLGRIDKLKETLEFIRAQFLFDKSIEQELRALGMSLGDQK